MNIEMNIEMNIIDMRHGSECLRETEYKVIFGGLGEHIIYSKRNDRVIVFDDTSIELYNDEDIENLIKSLDRRLTLFKQSMLN